MLKPVTAFILDLHTVPTGTKRRSACTCISVSSGEEGSVMTMESLRDILHRRQADLLDETNTDDATEDSSSHDDTASKTKVQEALLSTRLSDLSCLNNTRVDISTIPAWLLQSNWRFPPVGSWPTMENAKGPGRGNRPMPKIQTEEGYTHHTSPTAATPHGSPPNNEHRHAAAAAGAAGGGWSWLPEYHGRGSKSNY